jgi:hypothetical protein
LPIDPKTEPLDKPGQPEQPLPGGAPAIEPLAPAPASETSDDLGTQQPQPPDLPKKDAV